MAEPRPRARVDPAAAVGVYVLVLVVLQIFLLTVALDGFHGYDPGLAWAAAGVSVLLAASVAVVERLLRR
ncbi:MAG: hypothetical protein C0P77_015610 [Thermoanaerobacterales bacterium]|jgi:hypothetical protein|nr:hypothetical protein [Thermoanaerobacterales bacterium]